MISRTFGAPAGGATRGAHHGLESLALSLMTPPNSGGGGGSWFPGIVVVALGEPNTPVTCYAAPREVSLFQLAFGFSSYLLVAFRIPVHVSLPRRIRAMIQSSLKLSAFGAI